VTETNENIELPEGSIEELRASAQALIDENTAKHQKLAGPPYNVAMNPADILGAKVNSLIAMILPEEGQLKVTIMAETMIGLLLNQATEQVEKMHKEAESERVRSEFTRGIPGLDPNAGPPAQNPFTR
jgi:hypothetical protein